MALRRRDLMGLVRGAGAQAPAGDPGPAGPEARPPFPGFVRVTDYGAKGDGTTDDTVAINAAFKEALGVQPSLRGGGILFPKGIYRITDTLLLTQASATVEGVGWSATRAGRASLGSIIVWDGPPGIPMMRLDYCWGTRLSSLMFVGKPSAKPSAAVSLRNLATHPNGSNFNVLSDLWIGRLEGYEPATAEKQFEHGILLEGDNVNGDMNRFRNVAVFECEVGVRITQQQFVRNHFATLRIDGCDIGFWSNATISTSGDNWVFRDSSATDIRLAPGARLRVEGFSSAGGGRLVVCQSSCLTIRDGYWEAGPRMAPDGLVVDGRGGSGRAFLRLEDFDFTGRGAAPPLIHWDPPSLVLLANTTGAQRVT